MLNYADLSDVEFEYLCQDIMSKMLHMELRRFATGRDGGIDLTNDTSTKEIVVQVKHYMKTDVSGLVTKLKNELPKVQTLNPQKYYICCSKELSQDRIREIYTIFQDYMDSDQNIITLIEIDTFLAKPENVDILRKHYKLWLSSTNILSEIYNNDVFIDCESLLFEIATDQKLFVRTSAYDNAIRILEKNHVLLIIGNPGVGKTLTSKMLVLHYAAEGYRVRFTTNGSDLSSLKRALSSDRFAKEIILLDDCFGQAYFNMRETQENELLSLIQFINISKNKLLILNSRVTIYQEATIRTPKLETSRDNKEYHVSTIDMSQLSVVDKAKIFYNHLFFYNIPFEYFLSIKTDYRYREIVRHPNYNPRIIEFSCSKRQIEKTAADCFYDSIKQNLDDPTAAWNHEYERCLKPVDRILLMTLFSLTSTMIPLSIVEKCFWARLSVEKGIDTTINHFEDAIRRLQKAFIRSVARYDTLSLSTLNPSINDFLTSKLKSNPIEKQNILSSAICINQYYRLLSESEFDSHIYSHFLSGNILNFIFEYESERVLFFAYFIAAHSITDKRYKPYIIQFIKHLSLHNYSRIVPWKSSEILEHIIEGSLYAFYGIKDYLSDESSFRSLLSGKSFDDLITIIHNFEDVWQEAPELQAICKEELQNAVEDYLDSIEASNYSCQVPNAIASKTFPTQDGDAYVDESLATLELEERIEEDAKNELKSKMLELPEIFRISDQEIDDWDASVSGAEDLINAYLSIDDDDRFEDSRLEREEEDFEIDCIFDR